MRHSFVPRFPLSFLSSPPFTLYKLYELPPTPQKQASSGNALFVIVDFCQTLITDITFVICSFFKTQRTCLLNTIAVSPCQAGNTTCTCENAEITAVTQACVLESCSVKHQLSMYPSLSNTTPFSALETGSNRNKSLVLVPN